MKCNAREKSNNVASVESAAFSNYLFTPLSFLRKGNNYSHHYLIEHLLFTSFQNLSFYYFPSSELHKPLTLIMAQEFPKWLSYFLWTPTLHLKCRQTEIQNINFSWALEREEILLDMSTAWEDKVKMLLFCMKIFKNFFGIWWRSSWDSKLHSFEIKKNNSLGWLSTIPVLSHPSFVVWLACLDTEKK